jgi:hypothetical protein
MANADSQRVGVEIEPFHSQWKEGEEISVVTSHTRKGLKE